MQYGVPPDLTAEKSANLGCGMSFTHQHRCRIRDLIKLKYSVEGRVSPSALLEFRGRSNDRRRTPPNLLSAAVYISFFNEVNIHKGLDHTLSDLSEPSPETTLAEVKLSRDKLGEAMREIQETDEQLKSVIAFIGREYQEAIREHKSAVDEYLKRTKEGCARLSQSLATPHAREFNSLRDSTIDRLRVWAARVDEATEKLKGKYA